MAGKNILALSRAGRIVYDGRFAGYSSPLLLKHVRRYTPESLAMLTAVSTTLGEAPTESLTQLQRLYCAGNLLLLVHVPPTASKAVLAILHTLR